LAGPEQGILRPGIVHRLDRDVSGLIAVTKTQKMFDHLKKQFKNRLVYKEYTALVWGKLEKNEGVIDLPIGRSARGSKMAAHPLNYQKKFSEKDKSAVTEYEVIRRIKNCTLVKIRLRTGRSHQIRVHFKAIGHPIVGDKIYFVKKFFRIFSKRGKLNRPFLHATKLGFYDLNHRWQIFESDLSLELKNYLSQLDAK